MRYRVFLKSLTALMIAFCLCFTLVALSLAAPYYGDTEGSITINALDKESGEPVSGATFRLYRFADAYDIKYLYTEAFEGNGMPVDDLSDEYLPIHLAAFAESRAIAFTEKITDGSGRVVFDKLTYGAYLVVPTAVSEGYLNPTPFIVTVPFYDKQSDKWLHSIDASPKVEADKDDTEKKTYISVKKKWQSTDEHPDSIRVSLLKDGSIAESVVLSDENNWYYRWDDLDKKHSWSVVEIDVPEGYQVSYSASQMSVVITNTQADEEETTTCPDETTTLPEETTAPEDTTLPEETTDSDDTTTVQTTTSPVGTTKPTESTTKPEELIDTGQLNWPVPVLSVAGLLLFSIGWAMLNLGKKDEELL